MDRTVLAHRLVEIAGDLSILAGLKSEVEGEKTDAAGPKIAEEVKAQESFSALRGLREAQDIVAEVEQGQVKTADEAVKIDKLPGFSPMQLRQQINQIVDIRQRATQMRLQFESVLKELKGLEDNEEAGLGKLKAAAQAVKDKEKFLVEAEKGILEFTAFCQRKRPGVEQMLADPATSKFGDKAGDFFNRVGEKLGKQVQEAVQTIYTQTEEDLTHMADCVRGLKVIERTASVQASTLKTAGLADVLISIKEWLAGKSPDSMASRIINFAGDIGRWWRGFAERTGLVKKATNDLTSALDEAMSEMNDALANS